MKRRRFLQSVAAGSALSLARPTWALDREAGYLGNLGLQLYTLRDPIGEDLVGTMKAVAEAGYDQVEPYGFPDTVAMVQAARDVGLVVNSSHVNSQSILDGNGGGDEFKRIAEQAAESKLTHLVIPYMGEQYRRTLDDYRRVSESCNAAAQVAADAGLQLSYHNHAFEFEPLEGGKTGYDVMVETFTPEMKFEIDVFWVVVAGEDPAEWIEKLSGRVSQLHLKDLAASAPIPSFGGVPVECFEEIGDGMIDMRPLLAAAKSAGVAHCHVEQDHSPHPIKSVQQSAAYLEKLTG